MKSAKDAQILAFTRAKEPFEKNVYLEGDEFMQQGHVKAIGDLSHYTPEFVVRTTDCSVWLIEAQGREEIDLPQKKHRLLQRCEDATAASRIEGGATYCVIYVDQASFECHRPQSFAVLVSSFSDSQEGFQ